MLTPNRSMATMKVNRLNFLAKSEALKMDKKTNLAMCYYN
jgi:hypothetical protein